MSRVPQPRIVTANALIEGDVVYLTATGTWSRDLKQAQPFTDTAGAEAALAAAARMRDVVGCYLAEVRLTAQGIEPAHFREDFRRRGPSNYAHGKQAAA
ncbi:MAG: DUF2849 domain-containing protein [Rhodobacteraceae bacterium]|nr:DUF2849 domain-containing protein [Paracoccaceae bacterium]